MMLRAISNLLIIACIFLSIYTLRDTLQPVAEKVGTYVHSVVISLENKYGTKAPLKQIVSDPEKEISTPGPLEVSTTTTSNTTTTQTDNVSTGLTRASIIYWTNQARKNNGNLSALTENKLLNNTAMAKTNDMFAKSYFEHTSPSGVTVANQAIDAGYGYIMIGENLALGSFASGKAIVDAWMNSPGHRANILNDRYHEIGVGVRQGTYQGRTVWIATQHFGLPKNACPYVDESLKALIIHNQAEIDVLKAALDAKKQEIDSTSQLSPSYNTHINEYNAIVREFNDLVTNTKSEIATYNDEIQAYNLCVQG